MFFNRSALVLASTMATTMFLHGCSADDNSKKSDTYTASTPATGEASTLSERNKQQRLISTLQNHLEKAGIQAKILNVKHTEVPNLYWINLSGMSSVYARADGQYIIQGDVIRLGDKQLHNVSESLQASENKVRFEQLDPKDLIIYPAKDKTKHVIYVFTDVSCPYCHKFHEHMDEINSKGIEVRYIAWPRGENFIAAMEAVWCSPDRKAAFDVAITGTEPQTASCKNPVREQYQLGSQIGVQGTPAIYNSKGEYLGGYLNPTELLQRLK